MPGETPHRENVLDPTQARLAGIYAQAALELMDAEQAARCSGQFADLAAMLDQIDGMELLLTVATMTDSARVQLVEDIFGGRLGEPLEGLLAVLAANGRLGLLRGVSRSLREQLDRREGRVPVSVITARPLDAGTLARIEAVIRSKFAAQPVIRATVSSDVLGGLVVRIGDRRYDASVAGELKRLKDSLTHARGSDREAGSEAEEA